MEEDKFPNIDEYFAKVDEFFYNDVDEYFANRDYDQSVNEYLEKHLEKYGKPENPKSIYNVTFGGYIKPGQSIEVLEVIEKYLSNKKFKVFFDGSKILNYKKPYNKWTCDTGTCLYDISITNSCLIGAIQCNNNGWFYQNCLHWYVKIDK